MMCCVCGKKPVKWIMPDIGSYTYGFCSKVCIANNSIKHYEMKEFKQSENTK